MKIKRLVTLLLMAVMSMCICTSCVKHAEVDGSESEDNAELTTEIVGAEVSVDGSHGSITLNIPETWNWETTNNGGKLQTGTIGSYGIILKPNETKQGQIEVFYTNAFGLCGTGLFSNKTMLADNPVWVYTYDGSKNWDYIVFDSDSPKIVVCHTDCSTWTDEMWDEAWLILETTSFFYD